MAVAIVVHVAHHCMDAGRVNLQAEPDEGAVELGAGEQTVLRGVEGAEGVEQVETALGKQHADADHHRALA